MIEETHSVKIAHCARRPFFKLEYDATQAVVQLIYKGKKADGSINHDFASRWENELYFRRVLAMGFTISTQGAFKS
jgi:hypothetical protein